MLINTAIHASKSQRKRKIILIIKINKSNKQERKERKRLRELRRWEIRALGLYV